MQTRKLCNLLNINRYIQYLHTKKKKKRLDKVLNEYI